MSQSIKVIYQGLELNERRHYFVPYQWLVKYIPVLACKVTWANKNGDDSRLILLQPDTFLGEVGSHMIEFALQYASDKHHGLEPFTQFSDVPWLQLHVMIELVDYLLMTQYIEDLCKFISKIDVSSFPKTPTNKWYSALIVAYHGLANNLPHHHYSSSEVRRAIARHQLMSSTVWENICTCDNHPESPLVGELFSRLYTKNSKAIRTYWDDMKNCRLTSLLEYSYWTVATIEQLFDDIQICKPKDELRCPAFGRNFILLLHFWLAKHDTIPGLSAELAKLSTLQRKDDLRRRWAILYSVIKYSGQKTEQILSSLSVFHDKCMRIEDLFTKRQTTNYETCHNCLETPYSTKLVNLCSLPCMNCDSCNRPTCQKCRDTCGMCTKTTCSECILFFTRDRCVADMMSSVLRSSVRHDCSVICGRCL